MYRRTSTANASSLPRAVASTSSPSGRASSGPGDNATAHDLLVRSLLRFFEGERNLGAITGQRTLQRLGCFLLRLGEGRAGPAGQVRQRLGPSNRVAFQRDGAGRTET